MKTKFLSLLKMLAVKFWLSIKRFPLSIIMAALVVILSIVLNHLDSSTNESLIELLKRTALIFALGFPLFLSVTIFFERKPDIKFSIKAESFMLGSIALLLYFIFLLSKLTPVTETRYWIYTLVLYLLFLIIPMLLSQESYELYIVKLFTSFVTVLLYSAILYAGISALLGSIELLFKFSISSKVYLDIAIIIFGIIAPVLFLSYVPIYGIKLYVKNYPKVLKILFLYIIIPILYIFLIIFYIYFLTLLSKQWPSNVIFRIAFSFLLTSIIAIFFIYPLRGMNKWTKLFIDIYPKLLLPLLFLMFMTLIIRIQAYGVTFNRYLLVILAIWIALSTIYLSFVKNAKNILILICLAAILFFSVIGPWNFSSITKLSQSTRLNKLLIKYNMLQNNKIVKSSKEMSMEDKANISSIVSYYGSNYSFKDLKYLPDNFSIERMKDVFGFDSDYYPKVTEYFYNLKDKNYIINVKDYDYIFIITNGAERTTASNGPLSIVFDKTTISINNNGKKIYSKDITELIQEICSKNGNNTDLTAEEMTIPDNNKNLNVTYHFDTLGISRNFDSKNIQVYQLNLKLLIKLKK